jgi:hypothetical protein
MNDARFSKTPVLAANEAAASTGAVNGVSVDMQSKVGAAFYMTVTEATGLTSATMKLQTSPNDSDWTDATFDETVGDADGDVDIALADVGIAALSYSGIVQYVRAVVTVVATDVDYNVISLEDNEFSKDGIVIPV